MALLRSNGQYIKMYEDCSFRIYNSKEDCDNSKLINERKAQLENQMNEMLYDDERMYYDFEGWARERNALFEEYNSLKDKSVESGQFMYQANSLEEVYNIAKEKGYFGEVEDC